MVCISVSAVPPDFEMATKRVRLVRQLAEQRGEAVAIEIVHEMQARRRAQGADARHAVAGKLRQRLAAEAGAAGAEENHVAGVVGEPLSGIADRRQIVTGLRQPQQRQAAVGMARAQPIERALGAFERSVERLVGDAVRADVLLQCAVDGLMNRHGCRTICP